MLQNYWIVDPFESPDASWIACRFVNKRFANKQTHAHTYTHAKKVQIRAGAAPDDRSTSTIMYNLGLLKYAWTTFIHLSATAQQNMITLFWSSPETENKCYQKLYNQTVFFFFFFSFVCDVIYCNTMEFGWMFPAETCDLTLPICLYITSHTPTIERPCLFWLCSSSSPHSSCVWFGCRKVSAIAKVSYGNASCPALGVLSSLHTLFTLPLFPLAS